MRNFLTIALMLTFPFSGKSQDWKDCEWTDFVSVINESNQKIKLMKEKGMDMTNSLLFFRDYETLTPIDSTVIQYHFEGSDVCLFAPEEIQITNGEISVIIDLEDSIVTITKPVELDRFNVNTVIQEMKLDSAPQLKCTHNDSIQIFYLPGGATSGYLGFEYWICKDKILKYVAYSTKEVYIGQLGQKEWVKPRMELNINYWLTDENSNFEKIKVENVILQKDDQILLTEDYKNFEIIDIR